MKSIGRSLRWLRMKYVAYEEMLKELDLSFLQKRRFLGNTIAAFSYLEGGYREDRARLCSETPRARTRGNSSNCSRDIPGKEKIAYLKHGAAVGQAQRFAKGSPTMRTSPPNWTRH